nr:hypothetical protein BaRGS_033761 [Batillaria attramentaria]
MQDVLASTEYDRGRDWGPWYVLVGLQQKLRHGAGLQDTALSITHDSYERCELACKAKHHRYYARFQKTVEDGTTCKHDEDALCLAGKCLWDPRNSRIEQVAVSARDAIPDLMLFEGG